MSTVQPCLKTKEMSETSEFMESFRTVDEDKDSDEESFHLFLEGDEDHNKSDDKISGEFEAANKVIDEENECEENTDSIANEKNAVSVEIGEKQKNDVASLNDSKISNEETTSEKDELNENRIQESESEKCIPEKSVEISDSINSEETLGEAVKTSKTVDFEKEIDEVSETEDEILNKHITDSTEQSGNIVEELDPNIEASLLNDCDEFEDEGNDKCAESKLEKDIVSASEINNTEVIKSLVEERSCNSNEDLPVNGEETSDTVEENSDKIMLSVDNSQKCDENSSSNPDSEDLLDISMIKDSAQDDADIAEDARQLEEENDDASSKGAENVENSDDLSNSDNSEEEGKAESVTSENNQNELSDTEKEKNAQESDKEDSANIINELHCENGEDTTEITNSISTQNCEQPDKPAKRNLSESDIEPASKRMKLVDTLLDDIEMDSWDITELQSLISFSKFMTKSHLKKLTRADLEEFCVQKLCEAILHKSELGETNHQLKIQEQTIETLRRDQAVVKKQIKDLEIVNKKLMQEIMASNGVKPVLPVKITRSVGLQVRLPSANDVITAKRRSLPTPHKSIGTPNQVVTAKTRTPANNISNRAITQSSQPKQSTPILNQVLQNRNRTPVKTPTQNTPQRPSVPPRIAPAEKRPRTSGSFIDLTDEDDKKANNKNIKSLVPQGVRINAVPKSTVSSSLPSVVSTTTPQLMYVVQPNSQLKQGVLTTSAGQKAVLVNFQPTNGVINALNSSSVSVIPKVSGNIQLKPKASVQNSLLKVHKHPAPLPIPPAVQGPNDKNLKAIPPKPILSIRKTNTGIILQWRMPYDLGNYEAIASYQLYAYQETSAVPSTDMWRKVGDVVAMALPMACTLTQFADKNKYYFAVRPVDIHKRIGKFSQPVLSE